MAEIVNLRRRRKQAQRAVKDEAAAENRARFGLTKAERQAKTLESRRSGRMLDGHLREAPSESDERR